MVAADGMLRKPVPQTTLDLKTAMDSLQNFLEFEIEKVICYHGGLCNSKEKKQIEDLLN